MRTDPEQIQSDWDTGEGTSGKEREFQEGYERNPQKKWEMPPTCENNLSNLTISLVVNPTYWNSGLANWLKRQATGFFT